jgi:septal ring factor EnvC (AmiA/AmiB activator)
MTRFRSQRNTLPMRRSIAMVGVALCLTASTAGAEIVRDIERKTEDLRAASGDRDTATNQKVADLEAAIKRGERASTELKTQITKLEEEKRALEKVQVVLTSGLIGALVTAFVAILGTILSFSRGRAERDLKRLEVLEKSVELEAKGIRVPDDIQAGYRGRGSPT